jgi:hypothetical protein
MGFRRRQVTRIDANAPEIVKALEDAGCDVITIGYPVDLLVRRKQWTWAQNMWMLMEVKDATKTGRTYTMQPSKAAKMKRQLDFIAAHNVPVVTSIEQALAEVGLK